MMEVKAWKCEDGKIFETYEEAEKYSKELDNREVKNSIVDDINSILKDLFDLDDAIDIADLNQMIRKINNNLKRLRKTWEEIS